MTDQREIDLDEEELLEQEARGERPVAASVDWDVRDLHAKHWGTPADPWVARIESNVLDHVAKSLGISTDEVCARLSVDPTQANRIRAAKCMRTLGWRAGAQSRIDGKKQPRRYFAPPSEAASGGSPHGSVPPGQVALGRSPPVGNIARGVDWTDPSTWPLAQKGFDGQPDWVLDREGRIVRRPLPRTTPDARLSSLLRQRSELAQAMARVDAEIAKKGPPR